MRVLVVMLRKLSTQTHDYNLKLTKAELLILASGPRDTDSYDFEDYYNTMESLLDLVVKEAKRLGSGE